MEPEIREAADNGDFGAVVHHFRIRRGLTEKQLGDACDRSQSWISRLEKRGPTATYDLRTLQRIAAVLDIPSELLAEQVKRRTFIAGLGVSLASSLAQLEQAVAQVGSDERREPVLRLLGQAHQAMGEHEFDRLRYSDAAGHYNSAHQIGMDLGDPDMIALALIQLGDLSRRQRQYGAAQRLFSSAERHATTASVMTQVIRYRTVARGLAEIGDRSGFDRAIGQAEVLAERISPEHHRQGDHSPRGVRLERGQGLTLLGQPAAALAIYEQSAPAAFHSDRERGSLSIIRAQALAHAGHLDEGVRLAIEGLLLARSYQSPRHVSRVQRFYDRLITERPRTDPDVAQLRDALAA